MSVVEGKTVWILKIFRRTNVLTADLEGVKQIEIKTSKCSTLSYFWASDEMSTVYFSEESRGTAQYYRIAESEDTDDDHHDFTGKGKEPFYRMDLD